MSALILVGIGLAGLLIGGECLVRGAVSAARSLGISPMVIGLTLVGFGTSTPELVTSLQAALSGAPGIAVGNVVGSNIGNILLILGIAALIAPIPVDAAAFRRDGTVVGLVTLLALGAVLTGEVGRATGAVFLAGLAAYLGFVLWSDRRAGGATIRPGATQSGGAALSQGSAAGDGTATPAGAAIPEPTATQAPDAAPRMSPALAAGLALAGLAITLLGARALVSGAVSLAQAAGLSETVIGLTIVAIGTSLPELVTSVIAARRGEAALALGNVLGSNIFNILGILGITALVSPMAIPPRILGLDIWVMCAATLVLVVFARSRWTISRREGACLLIAYAAYLGILLV